MNSENILELNDKNWERVVEVGDKPVVVMFSSPTCPYCNQMEPYFIKYASEYVDKIVFAKLNIKESITIVGRYGIMGTPTFKFFCKGKPVNEMTGVFYPALLKKTVEDFLVHGEDCVDKTTWIDSGISGYV